MTDLLDRPIWHALNGPQRPHSMGDAHARAYAADIGPLAATCDDSPESLNALSSLVKRRGRLVLLQSDEAHVPPGTVCDSTAFGVQMVLDTLADREPGAGIVRLDESDAPAMLDLATRTRPGPFMSRTHTLGTFWGIKENGKLAAMAGERMKLPGYTEVSGVCTDPVFRGRGYAALLTHHVATQILARNETPILHAFAENTGAIRVYEKLGFAIRSRFPVVILQPA